MKLGRFLYLTLSLSLFMYSAYGEPNPEKQQALDYSLDETLSKLFLKNLIAIRHGTPSEKQILPIHTKEIFYQRRLNRLSGTLLTPALEISVSELNVDGEKGYIYGFGPSASIPVGGSEGSVHFTAHGKIHYLTRDDYGRKKYGGPIHWTYAIGLKTRLSVNTFASYMWQHMSNGDVYERNPALETHTMTLGIHF